MTIIIYCFMFILGACFGSFLCCQARRLRLKETNKPKLGSRSVCPHCKTKLKWYENIPLFSWLVQKGECRHCHHKIGAAEIISEFATGLAFLLITISFTMASASVHLTPFGFFPTDVISVVNYAIFILTLVLSLPLIFLSIYDGLYGELPTFTLVISVVLALVIVILRLITVNFASSTIVDTLLAIAILGGIYLALYLVSKGKWVGDGDWILGSIVAAILGTPWLAIIVLFLSNLTACLYALPTIKKSKTHKIYFGPFLVISYIVTLLLSTTSIMNYFVSL